MKRAHGVILLLLAVMNVMAQETAPSITGGKPGAPEIIVPKISYQSPLTTPVIGTSIHPDVLTPIRNNYYAPEPLKIDSRFRSLADSLGFTSSGMTVRGYYMPARQAYDFRMNPFARDYSVNGEIMRLGEGTLGGSSSHTTYPALGNVASASLWITQPIDERWQLTAGVTGMKYHMGRDVWNDFGISGRASYSLTDRISLNAFGQYYLNQRYHSIAGMSYMQNSSYGATVGYKFSDKFSLDVGAQRYYDVYAGQWRTIPVVQPTLNLWGSPISMDFGGLIYNISRAIHDKKKRNDNYGNIDLNSGGVKLGPSQMWTPHGSAAPLPFSGAKARDLVPPSPHQK